MKDQQVQRRLTDGRTDRQTGQVLTELSLVLGTSSVARAWSGTFDDLIGNVMAGYFSKYAAMGLPGLAAYPDFFAAGLIMILSGI